MLGTLTPGVRVRSRGERSIREMLHSVDHPPTDGYFILMIEADG